MQTDVCFFKDDDGFCLDALQLRTVSILSSTYKQKMSKSRRSSEIQRIKTSEYLHKLRISLYMIFLPSKIVVYDLVYTPLYT